LPLAEAEPCAKMPRLAHLVSGGSPGTARMGQAYRAPANAAEIFRDVMAKKKANREYVWLQCSETGELNYRTSINVRGGVPTKLREGLKKYCPRLRRHTLHKVKRK